MLKQTDEVYHQMEIEELFEDEIMPNLFAVSRIFSAARKQMNVQEYRVFAYALTHVKWKDECPEFIIIDKKEAAKVVGMTADSDHLSENLKREIGELPLHSFLKFSAKDAKDGWEHGFFVTSVGYYKNKLKIYFNPRYLKLFGNLDNNFITMWSGDVYKLHSKRAIDFYEKLRENTDDRKDVNEAQVGIRFFKELFNIPKEGDGSYMRDPSAKSKGGFDRTNFERKVINPVCEDLTHTDMIRLIVQPDGKFYEKVKRDGRVIAYKFRWTFSKYPKIANAEEIKQITQNPQTLKVAKDIVNGEKKPKKQKKNDFNNIEQHDYDFEAIEKAAMKR